MEIKKCDQCGREEVQRARKEVAWIALSDVWTVIDGIKVNPTRIFCSHECLKRWVGANV